jgi:hypothetical protein
MFQQSLYGLGPSPSPSERRAWERSIPVLAHDLVDAGLGSVEVLLEHRLPLSSRRVDAILAGCHPVTGDPSYVIVELKQWSSADLYEDDPSLVTVEGLGERRGEFLDYLRSQLDGTTAGAPYADDFLKYAVAPSRQLLAVAADEIREREQFVLLDQQRLSAGAGVRTQAETRRRVRGADGGGVLLALERPEAGRIAGERRRHRQLGPAMEPQGRASRRRRTAVRVMGDRSGRVRPGGLRLHRPGFRIRLERRDHRP